MFRLQKSWNVAKSRTPLKIENFESSIQASGVAPIDWKSKKNYIRHHSEVLGCRFAKAKFFEKGSFLAQKCVFEVWKVKKNFCFSVKNRSMEPRGWCPNIGFRWFWVDWCYSRVMSDRIQNFFLLRATKNKFFGGSNFFLSPGGEGQNFFCPHR